MLLCTFFIQSPMKKLLRDNGSTTFVANFRSSILLKVASNSLKVRKS